MKDAVAWWWRIVPIVLPFVAVHASVACSSPHRAPRSASVASAPAASPEDGTVSPSGADAGGATLTRGAEAGVPAWAASFGPKGDGLHPLHDPKTAPRSLTCGAVECLPTEYCEEEDPGGQRCRPLPKSCPRKTVTCDCLVNAGARMSSCSSWLDPVDDARWLVVYVWRDAQGRVVPGDCSVVRCAAGQYCTFSSGREHRSGSEESTKPVDEKYASSVECRALPNACAARPSCACLEAASGQGSCQFWNGQFNVRRIMP
jgi:hypothetical protein